MKQKNTEGSAVLAGAFNIYRLAPSRTSRGRRGRREAAATPGASAMADASFVIRSGTALKRWARKQQAPFLFRMAGERNDSGAHAELRASFFAPLLLINHLDSIFFNC